LILLNKSYKKIITKSLDSLVMADNSQIELYEEKDREMNYSTPCSNRSVSPHPGSSCSGLSQEPIFTSNRKEEI